MIVIGMLYMDDCPQGEYIPVYLLVGGECYIVLVSQIDAAGDDLWLGFKFIDSTDSRQVNDEWMWILILVGERDNRSLLWTNAFHRIDNTLSFRIRSSHIQSYLINKQ